MQRVRARVRLQALPAVKPRLEIAVMLFEIVDHFQGRDRGTLLFQNLDTLPPVEKPVHRRNQIRFGPAQAVLHDRLEQEVVIVHQDEERDEGRQRAGGRERAPRLGGEKGEGVPGAESEQGREARHEDVPVPRRDVRQAGQEEIRAEELTQEEQDEQELAAGRSGQAPERGEPGGDGKQQCRRKKDEAPREHERRVEQKQFPEDETQVVRELTRAGSEVEVVRV